MPAFTTTSDGGWEFRLEDSPEVTELPEKSLKEKHDEENPGYLGTSEKWQNYSDVLLYEIESLLRKFFEARLNDPIWTKPGAKNMQWRKYTTAMAFEELYGRKPDYKDHTDLKRMRRLPRILAYYSTRVQNGGTIHGRKKTKKIYHLSIARYKKVPPYSLRLRIEWLDAKGEIPTWRNMVLPKDNLKAGHARNPKTDKNMEMRREKARAAYNERYRDRAH